MTPHEVVKVAISYAHGPHDDEVGLLADRLNGDGVDCEVDLYEEAPPQGWHRWMNEMMTTRKVLVVASPEYARRFHLEEPRGVGLGATFESGLILDRIVASQGDNDEIIPVLFDANDKSQIIEPLSGSTYYLLPQQYEKLLRRLLGQPSRRKPPLGPVRQFATVSKQQDTMPAVPPRPTGSFVLFQDTEGTFTIPFTTLKLDDDEFEVTVVPRDDEEAANAHALQTPHSTRATVGVAYGNSAFRASVIRFRDTYQDGERRMEIGMRVVKESTQFGSEASYNGISTDELAEMRVRRLLLDERLPDHAGRNDTVANLNRQMFDNFVGGGRYGTTPGIVKSPLPAYGPKLRSDIEEWLPHARLVCVLLLHLTNTVERIRRLNLSMMTDGKLHVDFEGVRPQVYSNQEPTTIRVKGTCALD